MAWQRAIRKLTLVRDVMRHKSANSTLSHKFHLLIFLWNETCKKVQTFTDQNWRLLLLQINTFLLRFQVCWHNEYVLPKCYESRVRNESQYSKVYSVAIACKHRRNWKTIEHFGGLKCLEGKNCELALLRNACEVDPALYGSHHQYVTST